MCGCLISRTKDFSFNGQRYSVFIAHDKQAHGDLKALYFLDANTQFSRLTEHHRCRSNDNILYVGIGYQDGVDILKQEPATIRFPLMIKSLLTVAERRHFISLSPHALSPGLSHTTQSI